MKENRTERIMARNILYIQANENIANSFRETFAERKIELLIASSAGEAFEIMREREVGLLLIDINIPDMRLRKLVEICTRDYPAVVLNVCVDVVNSLMITKLVNRHAIDKIFVAPWDVREMIDEIEESLDSAQISYEQKMQERTLIEQNRQFQETLDSLTNALKKQQHSFLKLQAITELITNRMQEACEEQREEAALANRWFQMYLRMQTTDSIDISHFEDLLKSDLDQVKIIYPNFQYGTIESCLMGGIPKRRAENIRYVIRLLAEYGCARMDAVEYSVESKFMTAASVMFYLSMKGKFMNRRDSLEVYVRELVDSMSETTDIRSTDDGMACEIEFSTVSEYD